jgi:arylformamidase
MSVIDYEAEYDNRARVPEYQEIFSRWGNDAETYRREMRRAHRAEIGLQYGAGPRQTVDLFRPAGDDDAPLALFIHGGYWRSLEPGMFSHMARGPNGHGITVAVAGYDLAPQVPLSRIIAQLRQACLFLWERFGQRIAVYGHSAGAHLTACLIATDWSEIDSNLPADLTPAGLAVSGIYDLELLRGISVNTDLRLSAEEARQVSPLHWPIGADRTLDVVVGADESSEFIRQSRELARVWGEAGATTSYEEVAGANHFTVIDPLDDPASTMTARLVTLARRVE